MILRSSKRTRGHLTPFYSADDAGLLQVSKPASGTPVNTGASISSGLVLAVPMNENTGTTINDKSPSPINGTLSSGGMWADGGEKYQSVLGFDGTTNATVPHASKYNLETYTFVTAIKTVMTDYYSNVIEKVTSDNVVPLTLVLGFPTAGILRAEVYDGSNNPDATSAVTYNDGEWHIITVTRTQGGALRLYVDGMLRAATTDTTTLGATLNTEDLTFGAGRKVAYEGQIAHFHMWNRVLTGAPGSVGNAATGEIAALAADEFAMYR